MLFDLSTFYQSKEWVTTTQSIRTERLNEQGFNVCEYCGKTIIKAYDCICHHKEYLTVENVNDVSVSLNPENIMLVHHKCHNIIHNKFGYSRRGIYLVYGSPLSGKNYYVDSIKNEGDLIVDLDSIWQCVSGCDKYIKPNRLNSAVFGIRNWLLDYVKYRQGKWNNAYIIGGYPMQGERERLCKELGSEEIYIKSSLGECLERLHALPPEDGRDIEEWTKYIYDWWRKYLPPGSAES